MQSYEKKIQTLKKIRKFELLNRLACYACIIPFFYTIACLGKKQSTPLMAKVGTVGFVASAVAAVTIKNKQDKIEEELEKAAKNKGRGRS